MRNFIKTILCMQLLLFSISVFSQDNTVHTEQTQLEKDFSQIFYDYLVFAKSHPDKYLEDLVDYLEEDYDVIYYDNELHLLDSIVQNNETDSVYYYHDGKLRGQKYDSKTAEGYEFIHNPRQASSHTTRYFNYYLKTAVEFVQQQKTYQKEIIRTDELDKLSNRNNISLRKQSETHSGHNVTRSDLAQSVVLCEFYDITLECNTDCNYIKYAPSDTVKLVKNALHALVVDAGVESLGHRKHVFSDIREIGVAVYLNDYTTVTYNTLNYDMYNFNKEIEKKQKEIAEGRQAFIDKHKSEDKSKKTALDKYLRKSKRKNFFNNLFTFN